MPGLPAADPGPEDEPLGHLLLEERRLFSRFLILLRDNYKTADKAAFFLERRSGIINTCGITNLRDVLSHLASFLDPATPRDKRASQVSSAEEHLRRAILEPYEIAVGDLFEKLPKVIEEYERIVLPIRERHPSLANSPNKISIKAALAEGDLLAQKAKAAKARNVWDEEWERGVSGLPDAYEKLDSLRGELQGYINTANQVRKDRKTMLLTVWSIVATVGLGVLSIIVSILYSRQP